MLLRKGLGALGILLIAGTVRAQNPTPPPPEPALPAVGNPREAQLEERVRQLEDMVRQLSNRVEVMSAAPANGAPASVGGGPAPDVGNPAQAAAPSGIGGPGGPGQSLPPNPPPSPRFNQPPTLENKRVNAKFGPGFEVRTDDDEYILQFHNLTQFDYRGYEQGNQNPTRDSFSFPRQWFMFSGRMGKPYGYFLSLANGFDTISILDVFIDVDFDPRFRIRAGRMKTPFTYEFLVAPIQGLITPERSLFFNNFGQNRDDGVMAFGRLFEGKLDYAGGIFNGARNGFLDQNDAKHVSWFINTKPFNDWKDSPLENFNVGGSLFAGRAHNPPQPTVLRTAVATTGNPIVGVPFLTFNPNIREEGFQALWDLHFAYFYKQLAVLGEWGSGFQTYAPAANTRDRTYLPVNSYYLQVGYLLTGETRSGLGIVKPNKPVGFKDGEFGIGAWELAARYDYLTVGRQVFTDGLADPKVWTNNLYMTDIGFNWYMTQYLKLAFNWEHSVFGNMVQFAPNKLHKTSDMFMLRFQLFY